MNAEQNWQSHNSWADRIINGLVRVRLSTRVLLFAATAMLGALIYMSAAWPGYQPPINVTVALIVPKAAAVTASVAPVQQASLPKPEAPENTAAGSLVVDAARAVSAAAAAPLVARSVPAAPAQPAAMAAAAPPIAASARTVRTGPDLRAGPQNADNAAQTALPALPPGVNRIAVPTPQTTSGSSGGSTPNHIAVPPTMPPAGQ